MTDKQPFNIVVRICKETKEPIAFYVNWHGDNPNYAWVTRCGYFDDTDQTQVVCSCLNTNLILYRNSTRPPKNKSERATCDKLFETLIAEKFADNTAFLEAFDIVRAGRLPHKLQKAAAMTAVRLELTKKFPHLFNE